MSRLTAQDHLYLVDGSGYIFRAYHALPPLTRKSDGLPIGAVSGFCNMLSKLLDDIDEVEPPSHMAVIFDASGRSFRNDIYPDYKAHRPPAPEDLVPQFPLTRKAVEAFGIAAIECEGYEADDIIAAYAKTAAEQGAKVTIISSDKDLMQLVDERVSMLDTMKNNLIQHDEVVAKFGVPPAKVVDVQALAGDSADNVPGVPGIGIKTAAELIGQYGDLDNLLAHAGEIKQNKRRENLIEFAEQARISRELVRLDETAPQPVDFADMGLAAPDPASLFGFLKAMEFTTLTKRLASRYEADPMAFDADARLAGTPRETSSETQTESSNGDLPSAQAPDMPAIDTNQYECITSMDALQTYIEAAYRTGIVAIDTETDGLDAMQARLVGISLAAEIGKGAYIPLAHGQADGLDLEPDTDKARIHQLDLETVRAALQPLLGSESVLKILQNAKFDLHILNRVGLQINAFDDTMLIAYALYGGAHNVGMDELSKRFLEHEPIPIKTLLGSGKKQITFDHVPIEDATSYAAEDADITLRLWHVLKPRLAAQQVTRIYEVLDKPLVPIVVAMEAAGIAVDRTVFSRLSGQFAQKMAAIEDEIYKLAGENFNIASPKQLGEILFDKMSLPGGKKTKTGAWGTSAEVLEDLAGQGHELPSHILRWRGLAKLKSTYTDALPEHIHPQTGRIHTSYSLAATTTGRLSSSEPNLQNIPIRTEDGRAIRTGFIASDGKALVSADYSQIELRILAHMADIEALKTAFAEGLDIHSMTASEIFNIALADMTPEIRRRAKAINFGIIYGISAFGLANQLAIGRGEASDYIKSYFEKFPGIRDYMEHIKSEAHKHGFVETLFGRKVHVRGIDAKVPAQRSFAERAAINAPIQGSAADIIRRAMIHMPSVLEQENLAAHMLLQVHDELIFEVAEEQAETLIATVRRVMEKAPLPAIELSVPLVVDAAAAQNWDEAH